MNSKALIFFLLQIFIFSTLNADDNQQKITELIKQLGASSREERSKAQDELWKIGAIALPELEKAMNSDDPEVKDRATKLVQILKLGIKPEMPQEIIKKLEEYAVADQETKGKLLIELSRDNGGWKTIKTLLYSDYNHELANLILAQIDFNYITAAKDEKRDEDVLNMLELSAIFNLEPQFSLNFVGAVLEIGNYEKINKELKSNIEKIPSEKFALIASHQLTLAYLNRAFENYKEAANATKELYKIAFKNDSEDLKNKCKSLFVDTHLLAGEYAYLEKFWEKSSLEIAPNVRLGNIAFLQRIQGKQAEYEKSLEMLIKAMDNKDEHLILVNNLLINGEKTKALAILEKHQNYQTLAELASAELDFKTHEKWLRKGAEKEEELKLALMSFISANKGSKEFKDEFIKIYNSKNTPSEKITVAMFFLESGFKTEATAYLKQLAANPELNDQDAYRAIWALTKESSLAELFTLIRYNTKSNKISDAVEFVTILSLTEDNEAFIGYIELLDEKFQGLDRIMDKISLNLGSYCLDKNWNLNAIAIINLLNPLQKGVFGAILESEGLIRSELFVKAAHNLLTTDNLPKVSLPYYIVARAYNKSNDKEKEKMALEMAKFYDLGREPLMNFTANYLQQNGYHEYFPIACNKLITLGGSYSPFRLKAMKDLSNNYLLTLRYDLAEKPFMQHYLLSASDAKNLDPIQANQIAYQYCEFRLRNALINNKTEEIAPLVEKCQLLNKNNIEIPILLYATPNEIGKKLFEKYFLLQWNDLKNSLKEYPQNAMLLNSAAWVGTLCEYELKECLAMAEKAVKLKSSAAIYDTLAEVQFRLKMYKEALKNLEKAIQLDRSESFFYQRINKFKEAAENDKKSK